MARKSKKDHRFLVFVLYHLVTLCDALIKFLSDDYGCARVSVVLCTLPMLQMQQCRHTEAMQCVRGTQNILRVNSPNLK